MKRTVAQLIAITVFLGCLVSHTLGIKNDFYQDGRLMLAHAEFDELGS